MLLSHSGYIHDTGTCELLAAAGFEAIDMDDTVDAEVFEGSIDQSCELVHNWIQHARGVGLTIQQCHAPMPLCAIGKSNEEIEANINLIERGIHVANEFSIPYTAIHPFTYEWNTPDPRGEQYMWDLNVAYLKRLCKLATNTVLCLENMPGSCSVLKTGAEMARMLNEVGDAHLMVCFDTGHLGSHGEKASQFLSQVGDRVRITHIHDTVHGKDMHLPIGTGGFDWKDFKDALAACAYNGNLNSESNFIRRMPEALRLDGAILERKLLETLRP